MSDRIGDLPQSRKMERRGAKRKDGRRLQVFDRSAGVWQEVVFDAPEGHLLGADGNSLVFLLKGKDTLRWVPAPDQSAQP